MIFVQIGGEWDKEKRLASMSFYVVWWQKKQENSVSSYVFRVSQLSKKPMKPSL